MATEKQIEANQKNSQLSSGPKNTDKTRYNSLKHSLCANKLIDSSEKEELRAIFEELVEEIKPQGILQYQIIDNLATAIWEKARVYEKIAQKEKNWKLSEEISSLNALPDLTFAGPEAVKKMKELKEKIINVAVSDEILERYKIEAENRFYKALRALREA